MVLGVVTPNWLPVYFYVFSKVLKQWFDTGYRLGTQQSPNIIPTNSNSISEVGVGPGLRFYKVPGDFNVQPTLRAILLDAENLKF